MKKSVWSKSIIYIVLGVIILFILLFNFIPDNPLGKLFGPDFSPFEAVVSVGGPPNITSYYPYTLAFSASGTDLLYFNATYEDPDGTIPLAYWYVDGVLEQHDTGVLESEFNYEFGCGIGGPHDVIIEVTDGVLNDSVQWDVEVSLVSCDSNPGGNTGGSTGGSTGPVSRFSVDKDLIEVHLFQGERKNERIIIENIGETNLLFDLSVVSLGHFIDLSEDSFSLSRGKSKTIVASFVVGPDEPTIVYTGGISVKGGSLSRYVGVVLDILEREALFDLQSWLKNNTLTKKQKLSAGINLTDVGNAGSVDVLLEYFIKDFEDNEIPIGSENLSVNGFLSVDREFEIPDELGTGRYVFYVKLSYEDRFATSTNVFEIVDASLFFIILVIILSVLIIIVLLIIFFRSREKRKDKSGKKEKEVVLAKGEEEANKAKIIQGRIREMMGFDRLAD